MRKKSHQRQAQPTDELCAQLREDDGIPPSVLAKRKQNEHRHINYHGEQLCKQVRIALGQALECDCANPVFEDLDATHDTGATRTWEKRCYFLNCKHIRLRPAQGHDMVTRNPPRVYDRYAYYWGLSWKGSLCTSRRNAHAVIAVD